MGKKIGLLILLQFCFSLSLALAQGVAVTIFEHAFVNGKTITLGEIADIGGGSLEQVQRLGQLQLGAAPHPGSSFVLTKEMLDMRLVATGADLSGITWEIPSSLTVSGSSQSISGQALIDKAISAIRSQVGSTVTDDDLVISSVGNVQEIQVPIGNVVLSTSLPYGIRYNTPTTVLITTNVNEQRFTKLPLKFDVKLYRQIAVATREVNAGDLITEDALRFERMDTGKLAAGYIMDKKKIVGLMARRSITPGAVLTDSMVVKPIVIKRSSSVTLVTRIATMEVTAVGQAMQDGYEGQLIRVRNANSNKIILGKVLNESTVEVLTYKGT
ncbi:flagellar basal body P-ring formation chaperone FlgA [Pelosinus sp. UFO1]|uniref:flagellar basal body P-ring formation chaperone FlgA n=1 Tax=Pelosinus sp. UFO1 TaxID=484770 RepID=UPI0004D13120|nr:flagellar basal body P-ring formation chaperone FlgA [Pelosinus sp. UFO1]AIF53792.1 flagella basal body P-ring formation protein FlgA [Pelosinus sp. UFO1]